MQPLDMLPRHLIIKILSFTELDTKRAMKIPPGRLNIPRDFQLDLSRRMVLKKVVAEPNAFRCVDIRRPRKDNYGLYKPMYRIIAISSKAGIGEDQRYSVFHSDQDGDILETIVV